MMPLKNLDKNIPLAKIKATSVVHTHVLLTLTLILYMLQVCVSIICLVILKFAVPLPVAVKSYNLKIHSSF